MEEADKVWLNLMIRTDEWVNVFFWYWLTRVRIVLDKEP